jgi:hypothetical protein
MSYWLGYVVIDGGEPRRAIDFHGYSFLGSVADGPDAVLARAAGHELQPCRAADLGPHEGIVLVDRDRHLLAAWNNDVSHQHRHDLLPALRRAWPGYDVRWAYGGESDVAAYLGFPPPPPGTWWQPGWQPYETRHQPWDEAFFLVTVDDAGYALATPGDPADLLAGPAEATTLPDAWRLENLPEWWRRDQPVPLPSTGLHLDTASRTVTGWTVHDVEGVPERWAVAWPGWRWVFEQDRYDRHHARCADPVRMLLPDPPPGDGWPPLR